MSHSLALAIAACGGVASAQTASQARPELLSRLVACRAVADGAARLACYDQTTEALDSAERQGEVVVVDRAQVTAARRQLFGFQLPSVSLFEPGEATEPINEIETTLTRANLIGEGRWLFTLADGTVWRQIDSERVSFRNQAGEPVRVRKASLGSFLLTAGGSRAVRVRRQ
jgi:hypothetical protein